MLYASVEGIMTSTCCEEMGEGFGKYKIGIELHSVLFNSNYISYLSARQSSEELSFRS